jgi:DNA-binding transcriptional ArsR family regulator
MYNRIVMYRSETVGGALVALADPTRRGMVELLAERPRRAGELVAAFPVSQPAISRHLRILREAGLVTSRVAGQHRIYRLDRRPLAELDVWLQRFRPLESAGPASRLDALDTEMHRGRRARRAAADEGDRHDRTAG